MSTVQVFSEVQIDLDKILDGMAQLDLSELERFSLNVNSLIARRKAPNLPKRETELLQQINHGLSVTVRHRYTILNEKLLAETLTTEEHQEFSALVVSSQFVGAYKLPRFIEKIPLVDQIEQSDAERLRYLIELAQLRNISLDTLMEQLGIRRPRYA